MKKKVLWGLLLLLISCNTSHREKSASEKSNEDKIAVPPVRSSGVNSSGIIWKYSFNRQREEFEMIKMRPVDNDTLTGETLERIINNAWPKVQVEYIGTSNDTAYLSIPDSKALTQQMGSAGARSFMISTTWSFTELKGIRYVAFEFEYGDHAMPGVYNRNSWEKNKNQ